MSFTKLLKRLHKWFALVVGIQLFIWVVSGLVFSFINHKEVDGDFIFNNHQTKSIVQPANFSNILGEFPAASKISLIQVDQQLAFKITLNDKIKLVEVDSLADIKLDESAIRSIAQKSYAGGGQLKAINKVEIRNDENRGMRLPVWQLSYDDNYGSNLYLSAESGEFLGVRTDNWRIFDFFMMLHFMDFNERGNFNNGLIIFFASLLVLFSTSGMLLLNSSFSLANFTQILHRFVDNKNVKLVIVDHLEHSLKVKATKDKPLIDVLFDNNVEIDSECGGGGICGTCRVKVLNLSSDGGQDLEEHEVLSDQELAQGYRLACQLMIGKKMQIQIPGEINN
jgi:Na+-transporting NADH:ubiquinone oxidoreductase subunit F